MHILVVDDELLARQRLIKLVSAMDGYTVIGEADNGEKAVAAVEALDPDLVLMDVKMPGKDGLAAAREIAELDEPPAIIFCTAYDQYAIEAFDAQAVGYIVKPVHDEQLKLALEKAQKFNKLQRASVQQQDAGSQRQHISAKTRHGIELIPIETISCLVADQKYVTVVHEKGETLIDETLKELEEELAPEFIRVHRNALVARKDIIGLRRSSAGHYEVELRNTENRPMISRRHLSTIKSLISLL
ncbi:MAG: LytTR family DNA-binding domain-containing protein [Agarilytica sp.]